MFSTDYFYFLITINLHFSPHPLSHPSILTQVIIMEAIPDVPEEIDIQLQRIEFIQRKLIDKVADDHDEDVRGEDQDNIVIHKHSPHGHGVGGLEAVTTAGTGAGGSGSNSPVYGMASGRM